MPFICMLIIFQYQLSYILYTVFIMCAVWPCSDWLVFLIKAYLYPSTEVHPCVSVTRTFEAVLLCCTRTFEAVLLCWYIWSLVIGFMIPVFSTG